MTDEEFKLKSEQMQKLIEEVHEEKGLRYSIEKYKAILNNLKNNDWSVNAILFHNKSNHMVNNNYMIDNNNLANGCKKQECIYDDVKEDLRALVISFLEDYIKKLED